MFSYRDRLNFWVRVYSLASQTARVYEVSAGAWTQRDSTAFAITSGVAFTMDSDVRAGGTDGYAATIPAGQVGLWVSDASNNSFDNFKAHDLAGPFEVDGRWFSNSGDIQVDASNSNLISIGTASDKQVTIVRRGFRAGKYVLTYRFQWISGTRAGPLVRWVNPGDWIAVQLFHSDGKARLSKREADGNVTQLVTGTNSVSLTNNSWYTGRVVVGDDTGNSALQRLRFWVDTDGDGDFADETTLLDTTTIDDVWSAGHVGLFRGSVSNAQDFDDFKAGIDANADLDIADAGDEVVVDDDFATNVVSPTYDNNGNLTDDGVFKRVYDAWNRTRRITNRIKSPPSTIGEYEYDGLHRRIQKKLTNSGVENTTNDGGNVAHDYYYDRGRKPIEERNGSNQVLRSYAWLNGQLTWMESNGDPSIGNDSNPDNTASGESSESPADKRYFYHRDQRGDALALSEYVPGGGGSNGRIVERYVRGGQGGTVVMGGDSGSGESLGTDTMSSVGNVFLGNRGAQPGPHNICICLPGETCYPCEGFGTDDLGTQSGGDGPISPVIPIDPDKPCSGPGEVMSPWGECIGGIDTQSHPSPTSGPTRGPTSGPTGCAASLAAAMADARVATMLAQLAAAGCPQSPKCGGPQDCGGGAGGYNRVSDQVTMCRDSFSAADLLHELIHAWQFCRGPGGGGGPPGPPSPQTPESIACDEVQAHQCSGNRPPLSGCIVSLGSWCSRNIGACPDCAGVQFPIRQTGPGERACAKFLRDMCNDAINNPACMSCAGIP